MKPGKGDVSVCMKISGLQLTELKRYTVEMCEAYGLDGKIERYKGARPISLYRWDLDCIIAVLDTALDGHAAYPSQDSSSYLALSALRANLKRAYEQAYLR